jgi:FKBP-type peptidyl-prolyl cis-trans isomerase FklB
MKPHWIAAAGLGLGLLAGPVAAEEPAKAAAPAAPSPFKTDQEKSSYALGLSIAKTFKMQGVEIDPEILFRGIKDGLGGSTLMTEDEVRAVMTAFQQALNAKQAEKAKVQGEKNQKEGEAFLEANKAKEGVKTTASGLQYKVLKAGDGKIPAATDTVSVHYHGTLIDGTVFDSSVKRGQPAIFRMGGVIKGWTEALQLMPVGSKWQVFIPPALAYGERGAGPVIGPHAVLIFEVELLAIQPPPEPAQK